MARHGADESLSVSFRHNLSVNADTQMIGVSVLSNDISQSQHFSAHPTLCWISEDWSVGPIGRLQPIDWMRFSAGVAGQAKQAGEFMAKSLKLGLQNATAPFEVKP
ncbi:MAG: hypothetical protein AAF557_18195 [Pseudomonadota bacterium]